MQNPRLAARYAKSLLDLAIEQNSLDTTLEDVKFMESVCRQSSEFVMVLRSPVIHGDKKQNVIEALMDGKVHPLFQAFVKLLISKGRESNLPEILTAYMDQYKAMNNIKTVKLTTAVALNDAAKDEILAKVAASLPGKKIEMTTAINPDLIGGFVLEMEDKLFDASIRKDLIDIKSQFMQNIYVSKV